MGIKKIRRKLMKTYIKMLYAYAHRKMAKARKLEDKAIWLELELRDEGISDHGSRDK